MALRTPVHASADAKRRSFENQLLHCRTVNPHKLRPLGGSRKYTLYYSIGYFLGSFMGMVWEAGSNHRPSHGGGLSAPGRDSCSLLMPLPGHASFSMCTTLRRPVQGFLFAHFVIVLSFHKLTLLLFLAWSTLRGGHSLQDQALIPIVGMALHWAPRYQ